MAVTTFGASSFTNGQIALVSNTWTQLTTNNAPCTRVRLSTPTSTAPSSNTVSVLVLETPIGITPANAVGIGEWELPATGTGLNYSLVGDGRCIWLRAVSGSASVNYSIQA